MEYVLLHFHLGGQNVLMMIGTHLVRPLYKYKVFIRKRLKFQECFKIP